jgi:hypothetical protein
MRAPASFVGAFLLLFTVVFLKVSYDIKKTPSVFVMLHAHGHDRKPNAERFWYKDGLEIVACGC